MYRGSLSALTIGADTLNLDDRSLSRKAGGRSDAQDIVLGFGALNLCNRVAELAKEEASPITHAWLRTGDIGVHLFDAMGKAMLDQVIQRSIGRWRLGFASIIGQTLQYLIRAHRAVLLQQNFQHASPPFREPQALGTIQRRLLAGAMVMV